MQDDPALIKQLIVNAQAAQKEFRRALTEYKQKSGQKPLFLLERPAEDMRADAFTECRVFSNRHQMISALADPKGNGAELGVQHGHFSAFLIETFDLAELHLFDRKEDLIRDDVRHAPNVHLHIGDSSMMLSKCPDEHFDWIYIDGDHSYNGVLRDAQVAMQKVKPGGVLFFNDYTTWSPGEAIPYGIIPVVNDLVNNGLQMIGVALTATGYFDVALRR